MVHPVFTFRFRFEVEFVLGACCRFASVQSFQKVVQSVLVYLLRYVSVDVVDGFGQNFDQVFAFETDRFFDDSFTETEVDRVHSAVGEMIEWDQFVFVVQGNPVEDFGGHHLFFEVRGAVGGV